MIVTYNKNEENAAEFIEHFSSIPAKVRKAPYDLALLPNDLWKLYFSMNYPANHCFWIAYQNNKPIARIGANVSAYYKDTGFIGFFECDANYQQEGIDLLKSAIDYLKQYGCNKILGPINFNTWFSYRLAEKHVDSTLYPFEPINPPFYLDLFAKAGLKKHQAYTTRGIDSINYKSEKFNKDFERATSLGYQFKALDLKNNIIGQVEEIYKISMEGFKDNYLFEPISKELFMKLYVPIMSIFNFEYSSIAYNDQGSPIAFFFAFEYGNYLVLKSIAVVPEHRGKGVSNAMMSLAFAKALKNNLSKTITALVKDEALSESYSSGGNFEWTHKYWLYSN